MIAAVDEASGMRSNAPRMTAHRAAGLASALAVALALGAGPAAAGEPSPPSTEAVAASLAKFDEGRAFFAQKRYDEARAAFEASHKLQASPNSLLYIGRCYRETGKVASAYVTLQRSAREAAERLAVTLEKRFAATRDAAHAEASELEARVPRLAVAVPSKLPEGFTVTVNGRALPPESWGLAVETDPGPVVVEASGARLVPFRSAFDLREGEKKRVEVEAARLPTATLGLAIASWPTGLVVELDGGALAPQDVARSRELDPGRHRVVARAPGYLPFTWEKDLEDGSRARVVIDPKPAPVPTVKRGTPPWLFFASAAAAGGATAVASVVALDASGRDAAETDKPALLRDPAERDAIRSEATLANGLFVTGAVLGAAAVVLFFTTNWRPGAAPAPRTVGGAF